MNISDLSQRLQNALDNNYDVIDLPTVLQVIDSLEGTTITKEQLETTRLAKHVNQLRRKTEDNDLARRLKQLLKAWREMVIPNPNVVQQQMPTNAPLRHPSSAISPTTIPANRSITNATLSNGTPTTPILSAWSSHSHGTKGAIISKENMIRRQIPTTQQPSIQHKSSSMPTTGPTTAKFPLPILNTNNGSSSLSISHSSTISTTSTVNSTKVITNRMAPVQPTSFANLINKNEVKQHIDGPINLTPTVNSSNQSSKLPKIPLRNHIPQTGATKIVNNRSRSPLFLMGNRTSNFRLPAHADVDDANSRPSFPNTDHSSKFDHPNNNTRKTFNGFGNVFNAKKISPTQSVPFPSELHDSHSGSSSIIMAPNSSISLPMTSTPMEMADSLKHKKQKRHDRKKERDNNQIKAVGTSFDRSMSNSSSLGMFNSTTNTTNTTTLGNIVPNVHKLSELTFTGKFTKTDDAIINIDSTSGSSSPKQMIKRQRTVSPALMQDSPCESPMLSVDNSNESATADSLPKPSNDHLTATIMPTTTVPLLETLDASIIGIESSNIPIPKRRGRKKGSTGVDRNMSLAGPSSSTGLKLHGSVSVLKSKMDSMRSVKKVKTTKELLAELQNRKPVSMLAGNGGGSTNSSPMLELPGQSLVSPSSLCSDNSQTNSTDMRSTTATPVSQQTAPTPEPHAGSDSFPNEQPKKLSIDSKLEQHKTIDDEIAELRSQLPPIDYSVVNNWSDHSDNLICNCKLVELDPPVVNNVPSTFDSTSNGGEKVLQIEVKLTKIDEQLPKVPPDLLDGVRAPSSFKPSVEIQQKPPMKSIFDLDYDEDNDPINKFKTNSDDSKVEADDINDENLSTVDTSSIPATLHVKHEDTKSAIDVSVPVVQCLPPPPIPSLLPTLSQRYEMREDPLCPAKMYFITNKDCVTRYHVNMLHNAFVPNVNGNWSVIPQDAVRQSESKSENDDQLDELHFVPKYNHMRLDKITKDLRVFDENCHRKRKLRKKNNSVDTKSVIPDGNNVDQDDIEVISSRLSNSSQTKNMEEVIESDGRDEQNCDLKTNFMNDGNIEDVSRVNELQAMDGQSDESSQQSRKRKGNKRKSVKYKIRKSSSDFSRDRDGSGGQCDGSPKAEVPTGIKLKFIRQVTTESDDEDEEETFDDEGEYDEENVDDEHEEYREKYDDLVEYNDSSNYHSNDNIEEICSVENNNDENEKLFDRKVDLDVVEQMDVDHFKLRRFSEDDIKNSLINNFDYDQPSPSSSSQLASINSMNHSHPYHIQPNLIETNHKDWKAFNIATTPQSTDNDDDKTAEELPLDTNELLESFNNISTEDFNGVRNTDGLEFKEWHEVVQVRSYNDELLTILPYVVID